MLFLLKESPKVYLDGKPGYYFYFIFSVFRMKVIRSNSNPEITEKLSDLDLNRIRNVRQSCDPIPVEEMCDKNIPVSPLPYSRRPRSNTIDSTSPVKSRRLDSSLPPIKQERSNVISPQFMFLQLYQAAGMSTSYTEKPMVIPKTKQYENSLKIMDRIPCQVRKYFSSTICSRILEKKTKYLKRFT